MNSEITSQELKKKNSLILRVFKKLSESFGKQNWWPADTPFEVIVGAILTQQTSWKNVEKAIEKLKKENLLDANKLLKVDLDSLKILIREVGFYNVKASRLKAFLTYFNEFYNLDLEKMKKINLIDLRNELLKVNGIGKETADSILLYSLDKPIFVVDAYTKRFSYRFGIIENTNLAYDKIREIFENALKEDSFERTLENYKEMHALIVELSKRYCKKTPNCGACVLNKECQKKGSAYEFS